MEVDSFGSSTLSIGSGRDNVLAAAELLDEHWFYHYCLRPAAKSKAKKAGGRDLRNLPEASSLPRVEKGKKGEEVEPLMLRNSAPVRSFDSLEKAGASSSCRVRRHSYLKVDPKLRSSCDIGGKSNTRRHNHNYHRATVMKKKKSVSDLEDEEVKGFEDLGFKFDKERLSPVLVKMIPGLRSRSPGDVESSGSKAKRWPYLSEAWIVQRSTPSMINWVEQRSAAEMKEQLRLWARVVASNIL